MGVSASASYPHLALASMDPSAMKEVMRCGLPKTLDVQKVNHWRSECNARHNAICYPVFKHGLKNLKVIDCKRRTVIPVSDTYCQYVALSYVWGNGSYHSSHSSHNQVLQDLPLTIEDSISLTVAFGYQYLWVDRYVSYLFGPSNHTNANTCSALNKTMRRMSIPKSPKWAPSTQLLD
jgi:hypothetical protein